MGKFDKYLFRCSALGHLMSEPVGDSNFVKWQKACAALEASKENEPPAFLKDGKTPAKNWIKWSDKVVELQNKVRELELVKDQVQLSDGAKTHLLDIWVSETKRRKADINSKYIEKGLAAEEDAITLYSRIKKVFFKKNETYLKNLFIHGTPDLYTGKSIHEAERITDTKCSWNATTFYRTFVKKWNELYYWQGVGYMWLTGADYFDLVYCLVNTPAPLIEAEKRQLWYKLGQPDDADENWILAQQEIDRNMIFDDIPMNERKLEYTIERKQSDIDLLTKKIIAAREYLNWLDSEFTNHFTNTPV